VTAAYRNGPRLVKSERCDYLRPTVLHCSSAEHPISKAEVTVSLRHRSSIAHRTKCSARWGRPLVCSAITKDPKLSQALLDRHIHRSSQHRARSNDCPLNWLQPHEGNIVDFLFRARAFQNSPPPPIEPCSSNPSRIMDENSDVCFRSRPCFAPVRLLQSLRAMGFMRSGPGGRPGRSLRGR